MKFHAATERFDDKEVQEFIKDKEVLSIREHFFTRHEMPYIVLVVTYLPGAETPAGTSGSKRKKEAWRELISNEQLPLFNALREWRMERAKQDGVPPFVICTNQEFVEMVTQRPDSLAGLTKIYGFGKAKAEKYGQEILAVLATSPKPSQKIEQSEQSDPDQKESAPPEESDSQQAMFEEHVEQGKRTHEKKEEG